MSPLLFFEKLNRVSLYLLLLFLPIFFLPGDEKLLDFSRFIFFCALLLISFFASSLQFLLKREIHIPLPGIFYLLFFLLLLFSAFSTIFSISPLHSFWSINDGFLNIVLFILFLLILTHTIYRQENAISLVFFAILGTTLLALFTFLFSKNPNTNPVGPFNTISVFEAIMLPIVLILFFKTHGKPKFLFLLFFFLLFSNLIFLNSKNAWFILIFEILFLFLFAQSLYLQSIVYIVLLISIFVLSFLFYFLQVQLPFSISKDIQVSPSLLTEIYITKQAFIRSIKNLFLGTGPGTFHFDYSLFRPPILNQTIFWGTRFSQGYSYLFDLLLTNGLLTFLVLILLYLLTLIYGFKSLKRDSYFFLKVSILSSFVGSIIAQLTIPSNFILLFLHFFLLAILLSYITKSERRLVVSSSLLYIFYNFFLFFTIVLLVSLIGFELRTYVGKRYYTRGLRLLEKGDLNGAIYSLERGKGFCLRCDEILRDLSQMYLIKTKEILDDPHIDAEEKRRIFNDLTIKASESINLAVKIAPFNVANWNVRGYFYQSLLDIPGAKEPALFSYDKAIELEPASPYPLTEKARILILEAQKLESGEEKRKNLQMAVENLAKALNLKGDYPLALYFMTVAMDQLGNTQEGLGYIESLSEILPNDWGVKFQLGLLYWKLNRLEQAKGAFEKSLALNPNYVNAKLMLAISEAQLGEKERSMKKIEEILEKYPESQQLRKILKNIESGRSVFEGMELIEISFDKTLPEIREK